MRILLVEDDLLLGDGISHGLKQDSHIVDWIKDGLSAEHAISDNQFDAIILDLGLPKRPGLEVLSHIRKKGILTPVIILTARDAVEDRIHGLDLGADDYLTKPFDLKELIARIRAIVRRSTGEGRGTNQIHYGDITIDSMSHTVLYKGTDIYLPRREFDLLTLLLSAPGRVVSRHQMIQLLYSFDDEIDSNTLEVHIHNLRKKFGVDLIRTVRGIGYMTPKEAPQGEASDPHAQS
jgi:two-component system response regulator QseB